MTWLLTYLPRDGNKDDKSFVLTPLIRFFIPVFLQGNEKPDTPYAFLTKMCRPRNNCFFYMHILYTKVYNIKRRPWCQNFVYSDTLKTIDVRTLKILTPKNHLCWLCSSFALVFVCLLSPFSTSSCLSLLRAGSFDVSCAARTRDDEIERTDG